jgi:hypothetical protein
MAKVIKSKTGWNLGPIDGVTAKMKAVCKAVRLAVDKHEESPIDRIAVVSGSEDERNNKDMPTATNVTDARTAISKAGLDPWTDVVDISTLQPPSPNERVEPLAYA